MMQSYFATATLKRTYLLVKANDPKAFPTLPSYKQGVAGLHQLSRQIGAILESIPLKIRNLDEIFLIDSFPIKMCAAIRSDAARLRFIKSAKNLSFSLSEISEILDEAKHGNSPCPMVREIIVSRIEENRRKIKEMQRLQREMENAVKDWAKMKNSMPDGDSVCHLIEPVGAV